MNRYDFVYVFDVKDANPNGDPDAGNLPRVDPETGHGLVTDVCLKRKIRNYISLVKNNEPGFRIYFQEGAILNQLHDEAWQYVFPNLTKKEKNQFPKNDKGKALVNFMCDNFYDIRTFGAVMSTEINCGQVRGPVQISFARSVDPIVIAEHTITRSSVTNERDLEKERTMGRKFTVPYAVYVSYGFVNPFLAEKTGFSEDDLKLLWESLKNAFQFDQSAARPAGSMNARKLVIFQHSTPLGNASSNDLFNRIRIKKKNEERPPRDFNDYTFELDDRLPEGVQLDVENQMI